MVGRELSANYFPQRPRARAAETVLAVEGPPRPGRSGPGLLQRLARRDPGLRGPRGIRADGADAGPLRRDPRPSAAHAPRGPRFRRARPSEAIRRGVYLAPEDRKRHGLVLPMSVAQNTSLPAVHGYARFGLLDRARERRVAEDEVARFRVKTPSVHTAVVNLSGGNQQKVVLGKWLAMEPAGADPRRAHARDRRRGQGGDLPPHRGLADEGSRS